MINIIPLPLMGFMSLWNPVRNETEFLVYIPLVTALFGSLRGFIMLLSIKSLLILWIGLFISLMLFGMLIICYLQLKLRGLEYDNASYYNTIDSNNRKSTLGMRVNNEEWKTLPTEEFVNDLTSCSENTLRQMLRNRELDDFNDNNIINVQDNSWMYPLLRRYGANRCSICCDNYKEKETLRILPSCQHVFHKDCFDQWAKFCCEKQMRCPTCPLCNRLAIQERVLIQSTRL